jgi:hypothetical protein
LSFNLILKAHGLEPADVRLVRHADRQRRSDGKAIQPLLIAALRSDPTAFEFYQRMQAEPIFGDSKYLAAFLAMPNRKTVFVGIWTIDGYKPNTDSLRCAISGKDDPDKIIYDLTKLPALSKFEGRLAVDWGASERTWVQYAGRRDKEIVSLSDPEDPAFPGWLAFCSNVKDIPGLPLSWQAILATTRGVYLLVHRPSGQQYVGSAIGARGFLSRWLDYAATDHGGNLNLKGKSAADLDVVVLEAASSAATDDDILRAESAWKARLGTRVHGLNAN